MNDLIKSNNLALDRLTLQSDVEYNLLNFINLQIQKLNNEDSLKKKVLEQLSARIEDTATSDIVLLKLLEILSKQDNEIAMSIIDIVKNNKNTGGINPNSPNEPPLEPETKSDLTKGDVKEIKDILKTLESVKKSEF